MTDWNALIKEELAEEVEDDVDLNSETVPISCGALNGVLHIAKFLCPGIRQPCIEIPGEQDLISPKDFTVRANKDRQKDWKGSIRIGKNSVRSLMETKKLDFHNHSAFCSAKCQSRNYITPKELTEPSQVPIRRQSMPARVRHKVEITDDITLEDILKIPEFNRLLKMDDGTAEEKKSGVNEKSLRDILKKPAFLEIPSPVEVESLCDKMNTDPTSFWSELIDIDVADEVIDQMISSLNTMRSKLKYGNINNVAPFLSRSVSSLGVIERVKSAIISKKTYNKTLLFNGAARPFIPRKPILGEIVSSMPSTSQLVTTTSTIPSVGSSRKRSTPYNNVLSFVKEEPEVKKAPEEVEKVESLEVEENDFKIDTSSILMMHQGQSSQDILMQLAASIEDT